ncbi:hypothetical protein NG697_12570 [Pseudarthrobacter sp. MDT3-26]|uniref:hypothetical protein n=1 Tax=Pseudarthrobacter raffinosi TaxID=2953651 RepID=UPI00208EB14C|nr:hypothetical protein [Pseudarthrobacter sp. MDT3-26]MCO4263746.1 hypothetical protein [Pseudarthrobacter sp. MDT3-26]
MTVLNFPAAVPAPTSDEQEAGLATTLLALADPGVGARIAASSITELLREAYGVYWTDGLPQTGTTEAAVNFAGALPNLPDARIDYWLGLARYAVQVEMKHWADEGYAHHADHAHEVLVDLNDYLDDDDEQLEASKDNRDRWAELAEITTHYAIAEGTAFSQAA